MCLCVKCTDKESEGQYVALSFRREGIVHTVLLLFWVKKHHYKTGSR